jgi:TolB-like protein/Tfp pilus assembly protein PilF
MGTVGYMSPEQVRGEAADARSDIFSLGCVLYEMLSGRRTFKHDTSAETMTAILREEPESFAEVGVEVAPEVSQIVERCLEKNPDQRFQSAADLAFALRGAATDTGPQVTRPLSASGGRRGWWMLAAAAAAVAVVLGGVYVLAPGLLPFAGGPGSAIRSLAVLPLENLTGDADQEYFADGMTEALITDLSKIGALTVISRTSVMRYKGTGMSLPEIARELGVDALIEGSVQREGNIVRVTAQLIEAATDRHLWADRFERELTSILSLQGEVARAIAGEIAIQLTPQESERLATTREVNPETYELYLRGSFEINKGTPEGYRNGLAIFHQAVDADPTDPLAYAALGEAYVNLGHGTQARIEFFSRARAAAQRALELDPMNARARSVLADVLVYYEWEWDEAEAAFQRVMQLDSNLPWAHFHYSWFLAKFGRLEEAVAEHERAKELDPLTPAHTAFFGWLYLYDGMLDEAMGEVRATFELAPNSPAELNPDLRFGLARAYAFAGREQEARMLLAEIESTEMTLWGGFTTPSVYVALGDIDGAFRTLEQGYEIRFPPWFPWIGVEYLFEPLRGDPRLEDLMRRMD